MDEDRLVELALSQVLDDVIREDLTALEELFLRIPQELLLNYIDEEVVLDKIGRAHV